MKSLFHDDDWLKEIVSERDVNDWCPELGECCTAQKPHFKLHLAGTPSDPWNTSATRVFANDFLISYAETYRDVWAVRRMVLKKTRAYIKSLIKAFREDNRGPGVKLAARLAKNKYERRASVSPSNSSVVRFYNSSIF